MHLLDINIIYYRNFNDLLEIWLPFILIIRYFTRSILQYCALGCIYILFFHIYNFNSSAVEELAGSRMDRIMII